MHAAAAESACPRKDVCAAGLRRLRVRIAFGRGNTLADRLRSPGRVARRDRLGACAMVDRALCVITRVEAYAARQRDPGAFAELDVLAESDRQSAIQEVRADGQHWLYVSSRTHS